MTSMTRYLISLLLIVSLSLVAAAEDDYWMDGGRKLRLEQVAGLAADFLNDPFELQDDVGVTEVYKEYPAVIIYRLEVDTLEETRAFFANADPALSPVFSERGGGLKSLPGGVIVVFTADSDQSDIEDFLRAEGLESQAKKATWHKRGYVIATPPGMDSVRLANRLAPHSMVAISSPDWWTNIYSNR